jgi:MFS family permease
MAVGVWPDLDSIGAFIRSGARYEQQMSPDEAESRQDDWRRALRRALSRVQSAQTSGSILGAPLLTVVASFTNWRGAFVLVMLTYALTLPQIMRRLKRDEPARDDAPPFTVRATLGAYRPVLHSRRMLALYGASALRSIGWFGPVLYLGAFYIQEHGLSIRQVGLAFMIFAIGTLSGTLAAGRFLDGVDLNRAFGVTSCLMAANYFLVFTLQIPTVAVVIVCALAACAAGIGWTSLTTMLASESPAGAATTMTLNVSIFCFAGAASTAFAGLVLALDGYRLLGVVFPLFVLASAALLWRPWTARVSPLRGRWRGRIREPESGAVAAMVLLSNDDVSSRGTRFLPHTGEGPAGTAIRAERRGPRRSHLRSTRRSRPWTRRCSLTSGIRSTPRPSAAPRRMPGWRRP